MRRKGEMSDTDRLKTLEGDVVDLKKERKSLLKKNSHLSKITASYAKDKSKVSNSRKPFIFGIIVCLFGVLLCVATLYIEQSSPISTTFFNTAIQFFLHVSTALMILGAIEITVSLPGWMEYFKERLGETVIERSYLEKLSKDELRSLQTSALKAYFMDQQIDKDGSFLNYFYDGIHDIIGDPYRESYKSTTHISIIAGVFHSENTTTFKCRKARNEIQDEIHWTAMPGEYSGNFTTEVEVRCPQELVDLCSRRCNNHGNCGKPIRVYPSMVTATSPTVSAPTTGATASKKEVIEAYFSLEEFKHIDGLFVTLKVKAILHSNRFISLGVNHPTHGAEYTITYPDGYEIAHDHFGVNSDDLVIANSSGFFSLSTAKWLLPLSGIVVQIIEINSAPPVMPVTKTPANPENKPKD